MLGSMLSIAGPNLVLNTIVAEALSQFADQLEQAPDFTEALNKLIRRTIREHKRIIFNGNNYTDEWVEEAERRGLLNLRTTPEALPLFTAAKNVRLFARHCIFTEAEIRSRMEILLDNYIKTIQIESLTMVELTKKDILPAIVAYTSELSAAALDKRALSEDIDISVELDTVRRLSSLAACIKSDAENLEHALAEVRVYPTAAEQASFCRTVVFVAMQQLRASADEAETLVSAKHWPFPTYGELLYSI